MDRREQFMRAARAWEAKHGASVWLCDHGGAFSVRVDNAPAGFGFTQGTPEEFFRRIGGRLVEKEPAKITSSPRGRTAAVATPGPAEMYSSYLLWGANCGPVALAAILGKSLNEIRRLIPEFNGGMTIAQLIEAIGRAGRKCLSVGAEYPSHGIALVQTKDLKKGHVIAVSGGKVLDTFTVGSLFMKSWCDISRWERGNKKYKVFEGVEIE